MMIEVLSFAAEGVWAGPVSHVVGTPARALARGDSPGIRVIT